MVSCRQNKFLCTKLEIGLAANELPSVTPETVDALENEIVQDALLQIDERYRAPLMLYYLEDLSYTEIST